MPAEVAVAVVSYETRELLGRCLESLQADHDAGRAEVWVVDNASGDGSAEMVRERFPWATVVASEDNLGFGPAVNLVAKRTRTAWIAPANADVELRPGALAALLRAGEADPRAGILAPRLVLPGGTTQHSVHPFPTVGFTVLFNLGLPRLSQRWAARVCLDDRWDTSAERDVPWAEGAFLLVRRSAWDAAGGFDPRQWMYAEDLDLGWAVHRAGFRTRYVPAAVVDHHESVAARAAWGEERHLRWMLSTYAWLLRRRGPLPTRAIALMNTLGAGARAAVLFPASWVAPQRFMRSRDEQRHWYGRHRRAGFARRATLERHR